MLTFATNTKVFGFCLDTFAAIFEFMMVALFHLAESYYIIYIVSGDSVSVMVQL